MLKIKIIKGSPATAKFKLKIWFLSPPSIVSDGQPRTFYSFDNPKNDSEGYLALLKLAERVRLKGELQLAELYVNNPTDESKEVRLVRILEDGRKI